VHTVTVWQGSGKCVHMLLHYYFLGGSLPNGRSVDLYTAAMWLDNTLGINNSSVHGDQRYQFYLSSREKEEIE